jgi:hypothetical protein
MRLMSFALTTPQVVAGTKHVTRRTGWQFLQPGELVQAVERARGLKKGEHRRLAVLRIVDVRREPLLRLIEDPAYGQREVVLEGFAGDTPRQFLDRFVATHDCTIDDDVTRIEFEYVR